MPRTRPSIDVRTARLVRLAGRLDEVTSAMAGLLSEFRAELAGWLASTGTGRLADSEAARIAGELTEGETEVLQALAELRAFDHKSRASADRLSRRAYHVADPERLKHPAARLAKRKLIAAVAGPGGGRWLTPLGRTVASVASPVGTE